MNGDLNKLLIDIKEKIKETVLGVCDEYDIDETRIGYKLDLSLEMPIEDTIQKGEM